MSPLSPDPRKWRSSIEQFQVRRKAERDYISQAIRRCGAKIIDEPTGSIAPLVYTIVTPDSEHLTLICYAFRANGNPAKGRPNDEHRFQIKYGSDFTRYYTLHISQKPQELTLFFGIHFDADVLVAADPAMNNPTWFSKSIEFKEGDVIAIQRNRWCGWERDRHGGGRRKSPKPLMSFQNEVLLGFGPENFLEYIYLERMATAAPPGERLSVISNWFESSDLQAASRTNESMNRKRHALEHEWGLSALEVLDLIQGAGRMRTNVRGSVAEKHLEEHLRRQAKIVEVNWLQKDGTADFSIATRFQKYRVECKNISGSTLTDGTMKVDFQRTRAPISDRCKRYYHPDEFEILAACTHPVTRKWDFLFAATRQLRRRSDCPDRIDPNVKIGDGWTHDITTLL